MITDLVHQIGGDSIVVVGLMKAGIDPHTYKASEGDVHQLSSAQAIFYNGLHLEGKMADVFKKMNKSGYQTYAISDALLPEDIISSTDFSGNYDPHIWFSIQNWKKAAMYVSGVLSELHPNNKMYYENNLCKYLQSLDDMAVELQKKINKIPSEKKILITAHDAFGYFAKEFDFQVKGLQGFSSAAEAGTANMIALAEFIAENEIPAIFVESSVPEKTMIALQMAVENRGFNVRIGGMLYSDALGNPETPQGTYIGMYHANIETITKALYVRE